MSEEFPFCENSVGLVLYPNDYHDDIWFCEREDLEVICFCGTSYFRLNEPYRSISTWVEHSSLFEERIKRDSRIVDVIYASEIVNRCVWLQVDKYSFYEASVEYPEWTQKSKKDAENEVKEIQKKQYEKRLEQYQKETKKKRKWFNFG